MMAFLGRHRHARRCVSRCPGVPFERDELAALLDRVKRARIDPDRVLAALGLDLALASDGAGHNGRSSPSPPPLTETVTSRGRSATPGRERLSRSRLD